MDVHAYHPISFEFRIMYTGAPVWVGGDNDFQWRDRRLYFRRPNLRESPTSWGLVADPPQAEWERFWPECERIGVWNVSAHLLSPSVVDGNCVHIAMQHGARTIRLEGFMGRDAATNNTLWAFNKLVQSLVKGLGTRGAVAPRADEP